MALTKEDLQAIRALMQEETAPIRADIADLKQGQAATNARLDTMQEDIDQIKENMDQIKEDTAVTREVVNDLGEWAEIVSDVLRVEYPVKK